MLTHDATPSLLLEGGHIGYGIRPSARGRRLGCAGRCNARAIGIRDV